MPAPLRPYQIVGSKFLRARNNALLVDDPGLGKTPQALHAADALGLGPILVVAPPIGLVAWQTLIPEWSPRRFNSAELVSYQRLSTQPGLVEHLARQNFDAIVIDEGQYLKNWGSKRTQAVYGPEGLIHRIPFRWVLSGTLAPNHAGELFPHVKALLGWPEDQDTFERKYTRFEETQYGRVIKGSKNVAALRERLAPYLLRRRKQDVLQDLPPLEFIDLPLVVEPGTVRDLPKLSGPIEDLEPLEMALATERRLLGVTKVPAVVEHIEEMRAAGVRKILVGAIHTEVIDRLVDSLVLSGFKPVKIDGRDSQSARKRAIESFQNGPADVFVGQLEACGTAITLTAASDVVFAEAAWTPGVNYQFACRAHRIGSRNGVIGRFLYVPGTTDAVVQRVLRRKTQEIAAIFD